MNARPKTADVVTAEACAACLMPPGVGCVGPDRQPLALAGEHDAGEMVHSTRVDAFVKRQAGSDWRFTCRCPNACVTCPDCGNGCAACSLEAADRRRRNVVTDEALYVAAARDNARAQAVDLSHMKTSELMRWASAFVRVAAPGSMRRRAEGIAAELDRRAEALALEATAAMLPTAEARDTLRRIGEVRS